MKSCIYYLFLYFKCQYFTKIITYFLYEQFCFGIFLTLNEWVYAFCVNISLYVFLSGSYIISCQYLIPLVLQKGKVKCSFHTSITGVVEFCILLGSFSRCLYELNVQHLLDNMQTSAVSEYVFNFMQRKFRVFLLLVVQLFIIFN